MGAAASVTTSPPVLVSSGGSGSRVIGVVASMASVATGSVASCAVGAGCRGLPRHRLDRLGVALHEPGEALQEGALLVEERVDGRTVGAAAPRRPG